MRSGFEGARAPGLAPIFRCSIAGSTSRHAQSWYAKRGATLEDVTAKYGPYVDGDTPIPTTCTMHSSPPRDDRRSARRLLRDGQTITRREPREERRLRRSSSPQPTGPAKGPKTIRLQTPRAPPRPRDAPRRPLRRRRASSPPRPRRPGSTCAGRPWRRSRSRDTA